MDIKEIPPYMVAVIDAYSINLSKCRTENLEVFYTPVIDFYASSSDQHMVSFVTEINEITPRAAIMKAVKIAEGFSTNFYEGIHIFDEDGKEILGELDFKLNDIVNPKVPELEPIPPMTPVWGNFFFVTIHKTILEDEEIYSAVLSFDMNSLDEANHALTIVTAISGDQIDEVIENAVMTGMKIIPAYKEDIAIVSTDGAVTTHINSVSDYLENIGFEVPKIEMPKYLH